VKYPRFRVTMVEGFDIPGPPSGKVGSHQKPTLSAHVLDSLHLYKLVATYRSTDRLRGGSLLGSRGGGQVRGYDGAIRAAQEHADRLNEIHRQWLHRERMRELRG
jgi:hypothetical protein